jgi:hypothetical protein
MRIDIHQIFYDAQSASQLDPGAIPFDNSNEPPPTRFEYGVFKQLYNQGAMAHEGITGVVSAKFHSKTGWTMDFVRKTVSDLPGYDLYLFDPPPLQVLSWLSLNCWHQARMWHGDEVVPLASHVLSALPAYAHIDLTGFRLSAKNSIYCNYWLGNRKAWDAFMNFVAPLEEKLNADSEFQHLMFVSGSGGHPYYGTHGLFAYVMERMLPTFLATTDHGLKVWKADLSVAIEKHLNDIGMGRLLPVIARLDGGARFNPYPVANQLNLLQHHYFALTRGFPAPTVSLAEVLTRLETELSLFN